MNAIEWKRKAVKQLKKIHPTQQKNIVQAAPTGRLSKLSRGKGFDQTSAQLPLAGWELPDLFRAFRLRENNHYRGGEKTQ